MNPPRFVRLRFAGLVAVCLTLCSATFAASTIRVRADSWMPYNGQPDDSQPGYAIEVLRAIFEPQGFAVDYSIAPWAAALADATAGQIEAVIGANAQESAALARPQEPIGEPSVAVFTKKANPWVLENVASLTKVRLGVVAGYSYGSPFDNYLTHAAAGAVRSFEGETPLRDAMDQLDAGQIDAVIETLPVWAWNVRLSGRAPASYRPASIQPGEPIYIAFSPKADPRLVQLFDAGLRDLRASGKLAAILARYNLSDWR